MDAAMKGVVFTEFLDLVEQRHGLGAVDAMLLAASLPNGGAYTAIGNYDEREIVLLAEALAAQLRRPVDEVLRNYGRHLGTVLVQRFPRAFGNRDSAPAFLASLETSLPEVLQRCSRLEPSDHGTASGGGPRVLQYTAGRSLGSLAHGLLEGCLVHCRGCESLRVEPFGEVQLFTVWVHEETPCPTAR